jgi:hypothetical protein
MKSIDDEAKLLAEKHYQIEPGIQEIIQLNQQVDCELVPVEKIVLLEVNENTVPSGIVPIEFGPAPGSGIHYPTVIVEVTPDEFKQIKAKELSLPDGWSLGDSISNPLPINGR